VSETFSKPISVIQLNDQQLAEGMKKAGVPDHLVPFLIGFDANTRVGDADIVTNDLETLIGRSPVPLRSFLERNKSVLLG
jgi:NAD(P)H dehydrogenase (quinone)